VSHSNVKTKRRFLPALAPVTLQSDALGQTFKLRITNAVLRRAGTDRRDGPVRIAVDDVEVSETETRSQAVVALLVDTSFSMVMENRWLPMKRTALALQHLVSTRFRSDALQIIAFGRHARTVSAAELTGLEGVYEQGTNLHHGLALAGRHLRRHPNRSCLAMMPLKEHQRALPLE
jgi:uncharacterized protein with von Willebrand factor type A (vWA) domain